MSRFDFSWLLYNRGVLGSDGLTQSEAVTCPKTEK